MKDENITRQLDKLKVFFLKYYPIRIKNVGLEEKVARQIVWDFKDGNHYEAVAQMTAKRLVEHFGEQVRNIVFSCVPASTSEKHEHRYKDFSSRVCELSGAVNGYEHVRVTNDRPEVHSFDHLAHRNAKNVITCMECGDVWNGGSELADTLFGVICPHCGKRLAFVVGRKRVYKEKDYFSIITTCKQYQVIRIFSVQCIRKVGLPADFSIFEVAQRWISPDGVSTTVARKRGFSFVYYDLWIPESKMEIHTNQGHYVYDISPACIYPKQRFAKEIILSAFI